MYLRRDQIFSAEAETVTVDVPEWGGEVRVRGMTASQFLEYQDMVATELDQAKAGLAVAPQIVAWCVVDEHGEREFEDSDSVMLRDQPLSPLVKVSAEAVKLSVRGMEADVDRKAEALLANPLDDSALD